MAFKKASFTLTADSTGLAAATVKIPMPDVPSRVVMLESVFFDDTAATRVPTSFTLFDSDASNGEDFQLFFIDGSAIPFAGFGLNSSGAPVAKESVVYPRNQVNIVDSFGGPITIDFARIMIRSNYLRCRVEGLAVGDVYTVQVVYETAGDLRF